MGASMPATHPGNEWLISVDSHAVETPDLWADRLPAAYRDRGPRWVVDDMGEGFVFESRRVPVNGLAQTIFPADDRPGQWDALTWSQVPRSCYDPKARVEAMDVHGELAALL